MTRSLTLIAATRERESMPKFPPNIAAEIMRFLDEGATGNVELNITNGEIRGCQTTRFVRADPLDPQPIRCQDSSD